MSIAAVSWALKQDLQAISKMILIVLADHHNGESGQCNPSVRRICKMAGVTQRTVEKHIPELTASGLLTVKEIYRDDGSRRSNQYNLSLGSVLKPPGSEPNAPRSDLQSPLESGIELRIERPEDSSAIATESSGQKVRVKRVKRISEVDDAFREQMRQRFGPTLGDTVQERIDEALAHKSASNYDDLQSHVRGWLRRDAERIATLGTNGRPGAKRVEPSNDLDRYKQF